MPIVRIYFLRGRGHTLSRQWHTPRLQSGRGQFIQGNRAGNLRRGIGGCRLVLGAPCSGFDLRGSGLIPNRKSRQVDASGPRRWLDSVHRNSRFVAEQLSLEREPLGNLEHNRQNYGASQNRHRHDACESSVHRELP